MIRVVGANPAMDRISTWPPLRLGAVNRAARVSVVPGGKGFNVARAAIRLGASATAYGFLGGDVGEALRGFITADGVVDRHTTIAAGTRVCFVAVEPDAARTTVLNEPGPSVTEEEIGRFLDDIRADTGDDDLLVISGSLPDSVPANVVAEILEIGRAAGARTVVDIHSEALRVAFASRPWMLKCNRRELLELLGTPDPDAPLRPAELAVEMQRIRGHGIEVVVVTLGAEGALLAGSHPCHESAEFHIAGRRAFGGSCRSARPSGRRPVRLPGASARIGLRDDAPVGPLDHGAELAGPQQVEHACGRFGGDQDGGRDGAEPQRCQARVGREGGQHPGVVGA